MTNSTHHMTSAATTGGRRFISQIQKKVWMKNHLRLNNLIWCLKPDSAALLLPRAHASHSGGNKSLKKAVRLKMWFRAESKRSRQDLNLKMFRLQILKKNKVLLLLVYFSFYFPESRCGKPLCSEHAQSAGQPAVVGGSLDVCYLFAWRFVTSPHRPQVSFWPPSPPPSTDWRATWTACS